MALMPSADFVDSYVLVVDDPGIDAVEATRRALERLPGWVQPLMLMRNLIVAPFGLKTGQHANPKARRWVGLFPVISESPERVVLGFDDRHLDFLVVIEVSPAPEGQRTVSATTLVTTHNLPGRIYLDVILPFHRRIVPAMLEQLAG
jgi:hypothetical protein